jgi:Transposase DDE domain
MVIEESPLVSLLRLVERMPLPPLPGGRGRPYVYGESLIVKALVVMLMRRLPTVHSLLAVLAEPTAEMQRVRAQLTDAQGRFPSRRTWERRLAALPDRLPKMISTMGTYLLGLLQPWPHGGQAAAIDATTVRARGGVWHKKDREAGVVPHTSIDTEAAWTKSGWHGWVYGWLLHLVITVSDRVWLPLAAAATPANIADNVQAPALLADLPPDVHFIRGDVHYNDPALRAQCFQDGRILITTKRGRYPHTDAGVEVRRFFHQLRSHSIENFNAQFKAIFGCLGSVPTRGAMAPSRFLLGAVLLYQLTLWHHHEAGRSQRVGIKSFLLAA